MARLRKRERAHAGGKIAARVSSLRAVLTPFAAPGGAVKAKSAPKAAKKKTDPTKAISVMAWIEDAFGNVLLVKQTRGREMWALPGGKVREKESLLGALRREVKEELGVEIDVASPIDLYDRPQKGAVAVLFRVILRQKARARKRAGASAKSLFRPAPGEISACHFHRKLPSGVTPSLAYFWKRAQRTFEPLSLFR
ncbi:MAG TPA: NUDIX hydrolase [Candidatus Methylacidiphilales bacterium]